MQVYIGGTQCTINNVIDSTKVEISTPTRTNPVSVGSVDVKIELVIIDTSGKTIVLSSKNTSKCFFIHIDHLLKY